MAVVVDETRGSVICDNGPDSQVYQEAHYECADVHELPVATTALAVQTAIALPGHYRAALDAIFIEAEWGGLEPKMVCDHLLDSHLPNNLMSVP